ncbi:restriction endonuclease [Flavobacterium lindanitolerans]|jgi:hypothetical protein|uniref:restriction endonuclease n=1 Tax=Flavobacterium lindanitolerans TaxID=428988 RepID=UPI0023EFD9A2|nr:restriction endonuclease [Flavobacterium lindanitolerans]
MKEWKAYERLVAVLCMDEHDSSRTVIPNAKITGFISKRKRQIDVLVDYRYDSDLNRRLIFDAKNRKRPIDIKEVEAFEGLMKDVNAKRGFIVCSNGFTKSAERRAQKNIGIRIVPLDAIEEIDINSWDKCWSSKCSNGLVLWDATPGLIMGGKVTVQASGKCDECGKFHVWCWGCGNKTVLEKEEGWQCACKGPWFWITSIEDEEDEKGKTSKANYLILVTTNDAFIIDRRPH